MYVVAQGSIEVYKGTTKVNDLGPGKVFGELALLYNSKRNATILGKHSFRITCRRAMNLVNKYNFSHKIFLN